MELKNNNISGGIELPPLTPIDTTKPQESQQNLEQNSLLQQAVNQKQEIDEDMKNKLKEIRYKIYIFFMLLIGLLSFPFFNNTLATYESLKTQITDSETKKTQAENDLLLANKNIKLVDDVKSVVSGTGNAFSKDEVKYIKGCILSDGKDDSNCKTAPENIKSKFGYMSGSQNILRNVALLKGISKSASGNVANFDQKKVLQGLNEEIIGKDELGSAKLTTFGEKALIKFSDDTNENVKLYKVPISIQADLRYEQLKEILRKIEKNVDYKNPDLANLYDAKTVNYDLGKAKTSDSGQGEDTQETTLNIDTYFYEN